MTMYAAVFWRLSADSKTTNEYIYSNMEKVTYYYISHFLSLIESICWLYSHFTPTHIFAVVLLKLLNFIKTTQLE